MSWLKKLFGNADNGQAVRASSPATPTAEEMNAIMPKFGQLMEKHAEYGMAVFDTNTLPVTKERMELILFCAIGITDDDSQVAPLAAGLVSLADYQPNVGPEPISMFPTLPALGTSDEDTRAAAKALLSSFEKGGAASYAAFQDRVQADQARLKGLADKALAVRASRRSGGRR